ncbi:MAG: isoprenylcysteine carboxylmethyltransferase family protein [Proteobacteria bacterium]|nr:isoprenylcysteine carboxylmethyltransferase family protein [Pseudomonadota bacterium]
MHQLATEVLPQLHKSRRLHTALVVAAVLFTLLFVRPLLPARSMFHVWILWLGVAMIIAGILGRAYCALFIGGRKDRVLVRQGPYSVVRNPLYVFSFIAITGAGLVSGMISVAFVMGGLFMLYYPSVVKKEEAYLLHKYGEDYAEYMRQVPAWLPDFRLWQQPELLEVMPKFVVRTALDASALLLVVPYFFYVGVMHSKRMLPIWLLLP